MSLHGCECLLGRRPQALHKTLVNTDLQLGRNGNNYATLITRPFIPLLTPAFSKSCLLKRNHRCLKHRGKKKKIQTQRFIIYFINTSWIPSPDLSQSGKKKKKRKHCHLFWYRLVSTSLGSGCHMSLLVYVAARDRLGAHKSAVGQKEEQKEKWRGGGKGGGERRGRKEVLSHHRPHVFIFSPYYLWPLLTPVTQSHKPRGQWGDLGGPSQPDECLKAILITVTMSKYGNFERGPGEISGRGNDRMEG